MLLHHLEGSQLPCRLVLNLLVLDHRLHHPNPRIRRNNTISTNMMTNRPHGNGGSRKRSQRLLIKLPSGSHCERTRKSWPSETTSMQGLLVLALPQGRSPVERQPCGGRSPHHPLRHRRQHRLRHLVLQVRHKSKSLPSHLEMNWSTSPSPSQNPHLVCRAFRLTWPMNRLDRLSASLGRRNLSHLACAYRLTMCLASAQWRIQRLGLCLSMKNDESHLYDEAAD